MTDTTPDANPFSDPAYPLNVRVRLERWDGDYAVQTGVAEYDGRALFDSEHLSEIEDLNGAAHLQQDMDWVFIDAAAAGLVEEHDGPFTVEVPEEFAEYVSHRKSAGMIEPDPVAKEELDAVIKAHVEKQLEEAASVLKQLGTELGDGASIHSEQRKELLEVLAEISTTLNESLLHSAGITAGTVLVRDDQRIRIGAVNSEVIADGRTPVETDFGVLLLDPTAKYQVEE